MVASLLAVQVFLNLKLKGFRDTSDKLQGHVTLVLGLVNLIRTWTENNSKIMLVFFSTWLFIHRLYLVTTCEV